MNKSEKINFTIKILEDLFPKIEIPQPITGKNPIKKSANAITSWTRIFLTEIKIALKISLTN